MQVDGNFWIPTEGRVDDFQILSLRTIAWKAEDKRTRTGGLEAFKALLSPLCFVYPVEILLRGTYVSMHFKLRNRL
ncbi:uncharacterized protein Bfra_000985 [Botrytis fragariae]|uniref:Uncharacterized protein n=1 Tax=Botrytis fragariae TaxID=1964551 RepID=A0A8H6B435_9HELO|nr:uncharacterized protein Bfra_000985 [Botrytis fragariae]KAF5878815.1 hypothetical protein Bfra_000985 [Botrytis fragariae]